MFLQILYIISCICIISTIWRRKSISSSESPPTLSGSLSVIGHAWKLLGDRKHAFNVIKSIADETLERGGVLTLKVGPRAVYILTEPDDCAIVSNACLDKDYYYRFAKPFLGNGLTVADVPLWKHHRKCLSQTFRQQNLNGFMVVFNHQAKRLVYQFKSELSKGPFNHEKYIRMNSLETACNIGLLHVGLVLSNGKNCKIILNPNKETDLASLEKSLVTAFGADVAEFGGLHKQYQVGVNEIMAIITERFQKFWLHSDFIYNWSSLKTRQDKVIKNIVQFTSTILERRKSELKKYTEMSDASGHFTPFMNLILELKETDCYNDKDVLDEINTIVAGSYDTAAFINTLALMLIGSHRDVQKRLYKELHEVFGNSDRDVKKEDLKKLVYLEAILKETIRLYPIAPIVARYIVKDLKLKNYTLKAGNGIVMLFWGMHRHKVWGPDAEQFRPERWLDGSVSNNTSAFGGFSIGRRACMGKTYAMMSMKTTMSHVLRSYHISSDTSKLEFEIDAILKITAGQNLCIEPRNLISTENQFE